MLKLPWLEPVPDHSTIHEVFSRIPEAYLDQLLAKTAALCIAESSWVKGIVAADSTVVETDRYETVEVKMERVKPKISVTVTEKHI